MTAKVAIGDLTATLTGRKWTCEDELIEQILNQLLRGQSPAYDPNPEHTAAREAVALLDGKILSFDEPKFREDVVY